MQAQDTKDKWKGKEGYRREQSIYREGNYSIAESWCNSIHIKTRFISRQASCMCSKCTKQCRYCIKDRLPGRISHRGF
ncbi:hypothetical protein E0F17_25700, partial [Escherichia coli]